MATSTRSDTEPYLTDFKTHQSDADCKSSRRLASFIDLPLRHLVALSHNSDQVRPIRLRRMGIVAKSRQSQRWLHLLARTRAEQMGLCKVPPWSRTNGGCSTIQYFNQSNTSFKDIHLKSTHYTSFTRSARAITLVTQVTRL